MPQIFKGTVIDEDGFEIEVWVENHPDSDQPSHVFLMYRCSQVGDFAFGQPHEGDPVAIEANRVAAGEAKQLSVFSDEVIDLNDRGVTWH